MNAVSTVERQLPDTLEGLARFVLIGREKLNAVRAEIRAIKAVELAAEVHEQKLNEAQEIAEAVLDAELKLGELTAKLEKASGGDHGNQYTGGKINSVVENATKTKPEKLEEIGIKQHTAERFEKMAKHPEVVEQAKADARAEGRIVTRQDVLNRIVTPKTQQKTVNEIKKQAYVEHDDFLKTKTESVVSFKDAQKDKFNRKVVVEDVSAQIHKAIRAVLDLEFIKSKHLDEYIASLEDKESVLKNLDKCESIITYLIMRIGG